MNIRRSITFISWALIAIIVGIELGSSLGLLSILAKAVGADGTKSPGMGIMALAFIDGILLYSWSTIKAGSVIPEKVLTPATKIANFCFFLFMIITAIAIIFTAIALITLMVSLLLAIPFGTIIYLIKYGKFATGAAQSTLAVLMSLKILFAISLIIGEERLFYDYRKFLYVLVTSFVANIIIGFLHGMVPGFLVSITDAVGAIIVAAMALVWLIIMFLGSIINVITLVMDAIGLAFKASNKLRKA
jgi:hypothetical protein